MKLIPCDFDDADALLLTVTPQSDPPRLVIEVSIVESDINRSVVLTPEKARQAARWLDELADTVEAGVQ